MVSRPTAPLAAIVFVFALACAVAPDSGTEDPDSDSGQPQIEIPRCVANAVDFFMPPPFDGWRVWPDAGGGWNDYGISVDRAFALDAQGTLYFELCEWIEPCETRTFRPPDAGIVAVHLTGFELPFALAVDDLGRGWDLATTPPRQVAEGIAHVLFREHTGRLSWLDSDGRAWWTLQDGTVEPAWVEAVRAVPVRRVVAPLPELSSIAHNYQLPPELVECERSAVFCLHYEDNVLECYWAKGDEVGAPPDAWTACGRMQDVRLVSDGSAPMCVMLNSGLFSCAVPQQAFSAPVAEDIVSFAAGPRGVGVVAVLADGSLRFWRPSNWNAEPYPEFYGEPPSDLRWTQVRMDFNLFAEHGLSFLAEDGTIWLSPSSTVGCLTGTGVPVPDAPSGE